MPSMKRYVVSIGTFLLILPLIASAGWQVVKPEARIPREPFFQAGLQLKKPCLPTAYAGRAFPTQYARLGHPAAHYAVSISGSLKENLERIMGRYHWKVIWKVPYDYNFDGRVIGCSLPNVVAKLVQPFPLQAVMYTSNRTVIIIPRQKTGR